MISKADLIQMARHVLRRSEGFSDRRIMHPGRDWLIGVCIASSIFIATSIYAGFLFWSKNNAVIDPDYVTIESVTYNRALVDRALFIFEQKRDRIQVLNGGRVEE